MAAGQMEMFAVLLLSMCVFHVSSSLLDPTLIGIELQKFARDALGVDEMQVIEISLCLLSCWYKTL